MKLDFYVGHSPDGGKPEDYVKAAVPGNAQLDWARAKGYPDYKFADNYKLFGWMEDRYWHYRAVCQADSSKRGRVVFYAKSIDYEFDILIDGEPVFYQEGMFTPVEIDITDRYKKGCALEVIIHPAPKIPGAPPDRSQAAQCCKPAVAYEWDWHPRLIPLGICDECGIVIKDELHIKRAELSYTLEELDCAMITNRVSLTGKGKVRWSLLDREGREVLTRERDCEGEAVFEAAFENPRLWWCRGQGEQYFYESVTRVFSGGAVTDEKLSRIGFRRARLVMHPQAWQEPSASLKTRSDPPITMELNGRRVFCKGSNWVHPEIFTGTITRQTYEPLLRLACEANMNMLRSWGGGMVSKDSFFDLCDEYGILVWQEFPLACNDYAGTPLYLKVLDAESRSIIKNLRCHPCVVMWCGGNELFNSWSGMTDQSLALRLLNKNCYELDPNTPFIATSPLMGMTHGYYLFEHSDGRDVYEAMPDARASAYTEFGCPGPSDIEILKSIIPEDELFPPREGTAWQHHHAFHAWTPDAWLSLPIYEKIFGKAGSLEELVSNGQSLQSAGYKAIFEEARRQKPACAMALNWDYNEPWPSAAANNLIQYPAIPKPCYFAVRDSLKDVTASARVRKYVWHPGDHFSAEAWMLSDLYERVPGGTLKMSLHTRAGVFDLLSWRFADIPENTNVMGPTGRVVLPDMPTGFMELKLEVEGRPQLDCQYRFYYKNDRQP